ncbi:MAG TPA: 50S ribosomal protein L30 [Candidatus Nanoarchaeia archaeon]|nr:50S ribosomal protein L30 [Candidatus Nanoarchaeia archaeon]
MSKLAIIRIRGITGVKREIKGTMDLLRLYNKNHLVIVDKNETNIGMLKRIKDFVTWGEISEETFKELLKKRGRLPGSMLLTEQYLKEKTKFSSEEFAKEFFSKKIQLKQVPGLKTFFRLKPPIGGFESQGIKTPFSMGGSLGYRGDQINILIKKML